MAEQRQPFRFRLPWLTAVPAPAPAPRPIAETQTTPRPTVETQTPAQPTTPISILRPPFRPPGIASVQPPPPQAQAPPRTESQPPSPSRAATESRVGVASQPPSPSRAATESRVGVASQPASPSRAANQPRAASLPPSPSRAQNQPPAASLPPSPSRAQNQPQAASLPPSPSRAQNQPPAASLPPSPSRAVPQSRPASLPPSPSRTASQPQPALQTAPQPRSPSRLPTSQQAGQKSSQPSSPSRTTSQVQPSAGVVSQQTSPSKKSQPITQESSQRPSSPTQLPSSVSQREEQKPALSRAESQEPQSKTEITSGIVSNSRNQTPTEKIFQTDVMATQPLQASGPEAAAAPTSKAAPEAPAPPQTSDSSTIRTIPKPLPESDEKSKETKEGKEIVHGHRKEENINGLAYKEPMQRAVTELLTAASGSRTQTKEQPNVAFQEEQRQLEKQEVLERKETLASPGSQEKRFKNVLPTHRMDRNRIGESHQKPGIFNGERAPLHKEIREDISKFVHNLDIGPSKQAMNEKPVTVITVAGENRGASMHLGSESAKKEGSVHIRRGYKINPEESAEATSDGDGSSKRRSSKYPMTKEDQATHAYINSNIQGINNSIMSNSSVTERNPGVHLVLSHNPTEPIKSISKTEPHETRKAEFNITPAEKLTYQPTVRRRCLRGLFMEPSDSDPGNSEKPRLHGCRYNCGEKRQDTEIGVL